MKNISQSEEDRLIKEIHELWDRHLASEYPSGCRGIEINGVDLILLDADTAGCVGSFLDSDYHHDLCRTAILGKLYRDSSIAILNLDGYALSYFSNLNEVIDRVLTYIIQANKHMQ